MTTKQGSRILRKPVINGPFTITVNKLIVRKMLDYLYQPVVLVHKLHIKPRLLIKYRSVIKDRSSKSNCILTASQHVIQTENVE